MRARQGVSLVVLLLAMGLSAGLAGANQVILEFTGAVNVVQAPLSPAFNVGDLASATVSYDPAAPDKFPLSPTFGQYQADSFTMKFGSYEISAPSTNLNVANDFFGADSVGLGSGLFDPPPPGSDVQGKVLLSMLLSLFDFTAAVLSNDHLPSTAQIEGLSSIQGIFEFCGSIVVSETVLCFGSAHVAASMRLAAIRVVPEPGALVLLGSAAVVLFGYCARRTT